MLIELIVYYLELSLSLIVDDEAARRVTSDAIDEIIPRPTSNQDT